MMPERELTTAFSDLAEEKHSVSNLKLSFTHCFLVCTSKTTKQEALRDVLHASSEVRHLAHKMNIFIGHEKMSVCSQRIF